MARLNDDAQWIVMIGFIVCVAIFFLALIVNESTLVGQTTAEGVLEFSKNDIQDLRNEVLRVGESGGYSNNPEVCTDINLLASYRESAVETYQFNQLEGSFRQIFIHFNNGITEFNEDTIVEVDE